VAVFPQLFRPRRAKWNPIGQNVYSAGSDLDQNQRLSLCFNAFSSREPVSTAVENAMLAAGLPENRE
jgi:hypothetical protein